MASYTIPTTSLSHVVDCMDSKHASHQMAFKLNGSVTAGTLKVEAKSPGDDSYRAIPDCDAIDLKDPIPRLFTYGVNQYKFTVSGFAGDAKQIYITDTLLEV